MKFDNANREDTSPDQSPLGAALRRAYAPGHIFLALTQDFLKLRSE
jgi:hypothetical protein